MTNAAKLIRTWNAIRVFSGRTVTGPLFFATDKQLVENRADFWRFTLEMRLERV